MFNYFLVTNGTLNQEFDSRINTYYVTVDENTTELEFNYEKNSNFDLFIIGNDSFKEGTNYLFLEILQNNELKTYTFVVNKKSEIEVASYDDTSVTLEIPSNNIQKPYLAPLISILCLIFITFIFYLLFLKKK
jgi:hypothetical protein